MNKSKKQNWLCHQSTGFVLPLPSVLGLGEGGAAAERSLSTAAHFRATKPADAAIHIFICSLPFSPQASFDLLLPIRYSTMADEGEDEFQVEKILNRRVRRGIIEYFIKWLGYGQEESTWEPRENLRCDDLIEEFEREYQNRSCQNGGGDSSTPGSSSVEVKHEDPWTLDSTLEPLHIEKADVQAGTFCFQVKWSTGQFDWVPAIICNERIPFLVSRFYENLQIDCS